MIIDPFGLRLKALNKAIAVKNYPKIKKILQSNTEWLLRPLNSANFTLLSFATQSDDQTLLDIIKGVLKTQPTNHKAILKKLILADDLTSFSFIVENFPEYLKAELSWGQSGGQDWCGGILHYVASYNKVHFVNAIIGVLGKESVNVAKNEWTPLKFAARFNSIDVARKLIVNGADSSLSSGAALVAASYYSSEITDLILHQQNVNAAIIDKASVSFESNYILGKKEILVAALKEGNLDIVKQYAEQNPEWLKATLKFEGVGNNLVLGNALHCAVRFGHLEIIDFILDTLGDSILESVTNVKSTPLHFASGFGHLDAVKKLIAKGIALNPLNIDARTPLDYANLNNYPQVVDYLLARPETTAKDIERAVKVNQDDGYVASKMKAFIEALNSKDLAKVKEYITENPQWLKVVFEFNGPNGETSGSALHYAAAYGDEALIDFILEKLGKATLETTNSEKLTALHMAAAHGNKSTAKKLIELGASINSRDVNGHTALSYSVLNDQQELINFLLEQPSISSKVIDDAAALTANNFLALKKQAFIDAMDKNDLNTINTYLDENPVWLSVMLKIPNSISSELSFGNALHYATTQDKFEVMDNILNQFGKVALNSVNKNGVTALHYAVAYAKVKAAQKLMEHDADVNAVDKSGQSVLAYAVQRNERDFVDELLKRPNITPATINNAASLKLSVDNYLALKKQALFDAIKTGNIELVKSFVEQNVQWLHVDHSWEDRGNAFKGEAIHCAANFGQLAIVEYIIATLGKDKYRTCVSNRGSPLNIAAYHNHHEIAQKLLENGTNPELGTLKTAAGNNSSEVIDLIIARPRIDAEMINATLLMEEVSSNAKNYLVTKCNELLQAISETDLEKINTYIKQNPEWLKVYLDKLQSTALHLAVLADNRQLVSLFINELKTNSKITLLEELRDVNGLTPLDYAVVTGNQTLFSELYQYNRAAVLKELLRKAKDDQIETHNSIKLLLKQKITPSEYEKQIEKLNTPKPLLGMQGISDDVVLYLEKNFNINTLQELADIQSIEKLYLKFEKDEIKDKFEELKIHSKERLSVLALNAYFPPPGSLLEKASISIEVKNISRILKNNHRLVKNFFENPNLYKLIKKGIRKNKDMVKDIIFAIHPDQVAVYQDTITDMILQTRNVFQRFYKSQKFITSYIKNLAKKNVPQSHFMCAQIYNLGLFGQSRDLTKAIHFYKQVTTADLDLYLQAQIELANICTLPNEKGIITPEKTAEARSYWQNIIQATEGKSYLNAMQKDLRSDAEDSLSATATLDSEVNLAEESKAIKKPEIDDQGNLVYVAPDSIWKDRKVVEMANASTKNSLSFWEPIKANWQSEDKAAAMAESHIFPKLI